MQACFRAVVRVGRARRLATGVPEEWSSPVREDGAQNPAYRPSGSDLMHPFGALMVGAIAGALFVGMFTLTQNKWKIDDVLGVWPLHGLCGTWGGIAAGIFGSQSLGGLGGVSFTAQLIGTGMGVAWAALGGVVVYGVLKATVGLKLSAEEEYEGADLSVHKISATPDREVSW